MCGIVGVVDLEGGGWLPEPEAFDAMVDSLAHRGPDGRGVVREQGVVLGHRRLAVLDPTPSGAQPMRHPELPLVITYNGEIYNFRSLRGELESKGHRFRTGTDTEVILAAYVEWGTDAVSRLRGIFAFGLWDGRHRRLWLVRDHLGVKPLHYASIKGSLLFASEMKAILKSPGFVRRPSMAAVDCFLSLCYVPAPLAAFEGIEQLEPGHQLLAEDGRIELRRYWAPTIREAKLSEPEALEQLDERLTRIVEGQMVSDVPLGAFLSGGLDSAALVERMVALSDQEVHTYSMGFGEASFDESEPARVTAELVGSKHRSAVVSLNLTEGLHRFIDGCDDLFGDSSSLAVYQLCQMTREEVTVALSGDGADELLAGYPTYVASYLARPYRSLVPGPMRRLIQSGVERWPPSVQRYSLQRLASAFCHGVELGPGRDFAAWRLYLREEHKRELLRTGIEEQQGISPIDRYAAKMESAPEGSSLLKRMLLADLTFYLPNDMLVKVDRMSMLHGLEVRVPFLDHELVDFCLSLPSHLLLSRTGTKKVLLRRHLASKLSLEVSRRPKRGFNVPVEAGMRGDLYELLMDALRAPAFAADGPLDVQAVERLARQHKEGKLNAGYRLYAMLVLALWWERWLGSS